MKIILVKNILINKIKTAPVKKTCFFIGILLFLLIKINSMLQPVWLGWNNYSTIQGFYDEPKNTIETIFLGSSRTITAFNPMELYNKYGICAYNMGTESQPIMASYYQMLEAYRLHPQTLKTVVLECTHLISGSESLAMYQKAIDAMHFPTKYKAVNDYPIDNIQKKYYYIPFFEYHSRWSSMTRADFEKNNYNANDWSRGYLFVYKSFLDSKGYKDIAVPSFDLDENAAPSEYNSDALNYFEQMTSFCNEKGLKLILVSTTNNWTSAKHNAIAALAAQNNLDYIDFNFGTIPEEINYNLATDMYEDNHSGYYGAYKMTDWIGNYLVQECDATDIRGSSRFTHMEKQLEAYANNITDIVKLKEAENICDYLELAMQKNDCTIMITVKDSAVSGLYDYYKMRLFTIGLTGFIDLEYREPYIAVIENGRVIYEQPECGSEKATKKLTYSGILANGTKYVLESGGADSGNIASCKIADTEFSPNTRGINIVVYDNNAGENHSGNVIDTAAFDTHLSPFREAGYKNDQLALAEVCVK